GSECKQQSHSGHDDASNGQRLYQRGQEQGGNQPARIDGYPGGNVGEPGRGHALTGSPGLNQAESAPRFRASTMAVTARSRSEWVLVSPLPRVVQPRLTEILPAWGQSCSLRVLRMRSAMTRTPSSGVYGRIRKNSEPLML